MINLKKSTRNIKYLVVHCSATREGVYFDKKDIDRWHKGQGWAEIGYNYIVLLDGTIQNGRDVNKVPAHVNGYNSNSLGIVYIGGIDKNQKAKDTRTAAQKTALKSLLKQLKALYPSAIIQGHRDFPKVAKECPCFNAKMEYANL